MLIQKIDRKLWKEDYNILCQRLYPHADVKTPFGSTFCVVEPLNQTSRHNHYEGETFFVVKGQGHMSIEQEEADVGEGDVIFIPPFSQHVLRNTSTDVNLVFLSVYWEQENRLWDTTPPKRVLIFSAPPTPNGNLHVGHLSGPYVAADVYRRFLQLNGVRGVYVSGSDDNQSYVPAKATLLGLSTEKVIEKFVTSIRSTLERVQAKPDYFLLPYRNEPYVKFVQDFFEKLVSTGKLELRDTQVLYCETCRLHVYEAHVGGNCPRCEDGTNGNGCEKCGMPNDCIDLKNPVCNHCKQTPVAKSVKKYYFPLVNYSDDLKAYFTTVALPPEMKTFAFDLLKRGLPDISASHVADWGIAVPSLPGQVIYEWLEMAAGYLFIAEQMSDGKGYRHFWSDEHAQVVQCFGFDNSFSYLTFIPALLKAYDPEIKLPTAFLINQFYLLDGLKFSTSRNHAVWGDEILERIPADVVRFYVGRTRAESAQSNFVLQEFLSTVKSELVGEWEAMLEEADAVAKAVGNRLPKASELSPAQRAFWRSVETSTGEMIAAYGAQTFSMRNATRALCALVGKTRSFLQVHCAAPTTDETRATWETSTVVALSAVEKFGQLASPLMPQLGRRVQAKFGEPTSRFGDVRLLPGDREMHSVPLNDFTFSKAAGALEKFVREKTGGKDSGLEQKL